jgi:hypothetical protein
LVDRAVRQGRQGAPVEDCRRPATAIGLTRADGGEIYQVSSTGEGARVWEPSRPRIQPGLAYWIRCKEPTAYAGPLRVELDYGSVLEFPPASGHAGSSWLLRGVFTEVDEGNRLRRAMIGLGEGQTDVQVVATVHDLSQGPPEPLYELATDTGSGSKPGAAPTLVLGPYGAAARFVMAGHDLERNVKQTAAEIAGRLAGRVQPAK